MNSLFPLCLILSLFPIFATPTLLFQVFQEPFLKFSHMYIYVSLLLCTYSDIYKCSFSSSFVMNFRGSIGNQVISKVDGTTLLSIQFQIWQKLELLMFGYHHHLTLFPLKVIDLLPYILSSSHFNFRFSPRKMFKNNCRFKKSRQK